MIRKIASKCHSNKTQKINPTFVTAAPCCSLEDKNTKQIYVQSIFIHYFKKTDCYSKAAHKKQTNHNFLTRWITCAQPFILHKHSQMGKPNYLLVERALNCHKAQSVALIILQQKVQMNKSNTKDHVLNLQLRCFTSSLWWYLCSLLKQSTVK